MKTPVGLVTVSLAAAILLAVSFLIATGTRGEAAGVRLVGGRTRGSDHRQGPRQSVGAGVPARRHDAGDRAAGPHAHRHARKDSSRRRSRACPSVWASGQGGLLDVVIDKSFAQNKTIYFCFAERTDGGGRTAVARAKLERRQGPPRRGQDHLPPAGPLSSGNHYGCRIAQADDGNLFVTLGEHFTYRDQAQNARQSSRQDDPDRARRIGAGGQPVRRPRRRQGRKSGVTAIATRKASRSIRRPASSGKSSTARAAATRST